MDIIKKCKKHGRQYVTYLYCPYCGEKLEEEAINVEYELKPRQSTRDPMTDLAQYEARGTAWGEIGIKGAVAFRLAEKDITPKELQEIIKTYKVKNVGKQSINIIKDFTEDDFQIFDNVYEILTKKSSWVWGLAKWRCKLNGQNCTNGEYIAMKERLKKAYKKRNGYC